MKNLQLSSTLIIVGLSLSGCFMPSGINPTLGCSPITGCTSKDYYLPGRGVWAPKPMIQRKSMMGALGGAAVGSYLGASKSPLVAATYGIIGLVMGHQIGSAFDKVDEMHAAARLEYALNNNPDGVYTNYNRGQVSVRSKPTATQGSCREFVSDVQVGGKAKKLKGTACKVNGEWELKELYN